MVFFFGYCTKTKLKMNFRADNSEELQTPPHSPFLPLPPPSL